MEWGVIDTETDSLSNILMEVDVDVITNEECKISLDGTDNYNGPITNNMLCCKDMGEDLCQGDTRGPLILLGDTPTQVCVSVCSWLPFPGVVVITRYQSLPLPPGKVLPICVTQ